MEEWRDEQEEAWKAMHAIAKTLGLYMDEYIIKHFGCEQKAAFTQDIGLLQQEIKAVMSHIEAIQRKL